MFLLFHWMVLLSALVTLHNLGAQTPDGRPLFQNLSLQFSRERIGLIGRNGAGKSTLLRIIAGELAPAGGSLSRIGTLGVLHQMHSPHQTLAEMFAVSQQLAVMDRILSGAACEDDIAQADWTIEARMDDALARMGLSGLLPHTPLGSLSGGQQTRVALAALIFQEPDFILLDEPTNNLDRQGRDAVQQLLSGWRGGALVVSHDRNLLRGMDRIVELSTLGAAVYGGNWDFYETCKAQELAVAQHDLTVAQTAVKQVEKQSQVVRERQEKRLSVGKKNRFSAGQSKLSLDANRERAQTTSGRNRLLAQKQANAVHLALNEAKQKIERLVPQDFSLAELQIPAGKVILQADKLCLSYCESRTVLRDISLQITGPEHIALCGANGAGKTTLLHIVAGVLPATSGDLRLFARTVLLDQHVTLLDDQRTIIENFQKLNPQATDTACYAVLARFMFRAQDALKMVADLSGGERLRAGLACVLGSTEPPELLILDEPTNHLDIVSLQAVEKALKSYRGALLVTSHDEVFLQSVGITRRIELSPQSSN